MFGPQLLNPNLQSGLPKYDGFPRFSNSDNGLAPAKSPESDTGAAGRVLLARLETSVESRFSAQQIFQSPKAAPADDFSPEAVSDRILGFVKDRLAKEKANGASDERLQMLFEQAKSGIEKGFAEAKDIIADQGLFNDEVKDNYLATVSKVQKGLDEIEQDFTGKESAPDVIKSAFTGSPQNSNHVAVASNELYYNQQRSFDMQVKTQDGDLVTIKVNSAESLSASSFAGATDNVAVSGFESSYSSSSRFSFSVEGDLDEGELAALNDLFAQVNDIADDFYAGDVEAAFNQALDVGYDASELAGFAVNMRRSEVVAVRQTYAEVARYGEPSPVTENPLQAMMDKLADFSAKVQKASDSLLEGAKAAGEQDSLLSQLLKELVPDREALEKQQLDQGLPPNKSAFNDFVDSVLA
ncbi:MAG: DUF5610 domain-containing protein [Pseudomonadales bacterium]|nr:DUF5610 domain-containing protein [Pseudomonadales bacterium]